MMHSITRMNRYSHYVSVQCFIFCECIHQCLLDINIFEHGGVFLHASVNESASVSVCMCGHSF